MPIAPALLRTTTAIAGLISWGLAAQAEPVRVVAGTPVVHSLAAQVMGDLGDPALLLDRGSDPHSFQLRPSQARMLADADLLFWVGPAFTPWLARAIDGVGTGGEVIALLEAEGVLRQDYLHGHNHGDQAGHADHGEGEEAARDHDHAGDDHAPDHDHADDDHGAEHPDHEHDDHARAHAHAHAHDHDHDHDHEPDDGARGDTDPHAWLDPHNAAVWIDAIAAALSRHDPANAERYAANAGSARAGLDQIETRIAQTLAPHRETAFVVFHDAYGYLAGHFGLNVAGTIALGDAAAPGAARIAELRALLAQQDVECVFPEVSHSSAHVDVVVEGTGIRVGAPLDPSGVMLDPGPDLYGALMQGLADDIAACLGAD